MAGRSARRTSGVKHAHPVARWGALLRSQVRRHPPTMTIMNMNMNTPLRRHPLCLRPATLALVLISFHAFQPAARAAEPPAVSSELFKSTKLVYEDGFDQAGKLNTEFWEVRQNTTWEVKDGVLNGSPSSKE